MVNFKELLCKLKLKYIDVGKTEMSRFYFTGFGTETVSPSLNSNVGGGWQLRFPTLYANIKAIFFFKSHFKNPLKNPISYSVEAGI